MVDDSILNLVKSYSKKAHLDSIPQKKSELPTQMEFIYNQEWENHKENAPYEILTQLMDCYYCLPERPDLATLFCWQAVNHSYNEFLLGDNTKRDLKDSQGIQALVDGIMSKYDVYEEYLWPFIKSLPDKAYRYAASYILKGYVIERAGEPKKFYTQSYDNFKKMYKDLFQVISDTFGDILYKSASVKIENNIARTHVDAEKNRKITYTLAQKIRELVEKKKTVFSMKDKSEKQLTFNDRDAIAFIIKCILYASRCNNFHGNVASRLNSDRANDDSFEMYTNMFLLEYMILGISLHLQGYLTDADLLRLSTNSKLVLCSR